MFFYLRTKSCDSVSITTNVSKTGGNSDFTQQEMNHRREIKQVPATHETEDQSVSWKLDAERDPGGRPDWL